MKVINKKGFTLVELLAIIVVLAIIALLAVQAVLPTLDKAKKQLFALEAQRAIDAAQSYFLTASVTGAEGLPTAKDSYKCVSIEDLISKGFFETKGGEYNGYVVVKKVGTANKYVYKVYMANENFKVNGVGSDANYTDNATIGADKVVGGTETFNRPTECPASSTNNENTSGGGNN